jgi:hypothetical protein
MSEFDLELTYLSAKTLLRQPRARRRAQYSTPDCLSHAEEKSKLEPQYSKPSLDISGYEFFKSNAMYQNDELIEANVLDTIISEVEDSGYAPVDTDYVLQRFVWVPFRVNGVLRSQAIRENRSKDQDAWIQKDGNAKIGPRERWAGETVAVFVLDEEYEK